MRRRFSSVEMVVLPVPESPKYSATSSSSPTLAEQCMGRTPCSIGSTKLSTVKMLFFISPAYPEAHTRTTLRSKSTPMNVSELVPSLSGSVSNPGTEMTVQSGSKVSSSSGRSEEHTSELQSRQYLVCRLLLEKKKTKNHKYWI